MSHKIQSITEILPNGFAFKMIKVEGGSFMMGDDSRYDREKPAHEVTVEKDFYLGEHLVTQALWEGVMGNNPSYFNGATRPVEQVNWDDTQLFLEKLNQMTGKEYRLPTESEWEYAARGGKHSSDCIYSGSNKLKEVGWYNKNSHRETKPVGLKLPNELGLYDMSGNVREWCADHWHDTYNGHQRDGSAWIKDGDSSRRVVRGGSWGNSDFNCRVSGRDIRYSDFRYIGIGFRLARY